MIFEPIIEYSIDSYHEESTLYVKYFLPYCELRFKISYIKVFYANSDHMVNPIIRELVANNATFTLSTNAFKKCIDCVNTVLNDEVYVQNEHSLLFLMNVLMDWMFGDNKYNLNYNDYSDYNINLIKKVLMVNKRKEQIDNDFKVIE